MDLKGIISISGMGGLYKVVAQSKNGFIVEALADKKRFPISSTQRISALEDISMYTTEGDVSLAEVLKKIHAQNGASLPVDGKSDNSRLVEYFKTVVPNFDQERVYSSDIKKLVGWYILLKDVLSWEEKKVESSDETEKTEKPALKVKKETTAAPKAEHKVKADVAKKGASAKTRKKI